LLSSWRPGETTISFRLPRSRTLSTGSLATLVDEAHAARADDAALGVVDDGRPEHDAFGLCTGSSRMRFLVPWCSSQ
jgi:hypothetical protein